MKVFSCYTSSPFAFSSCSFLLASVFPLVSLMVRPSRYCWRSQTNVSAPRAHDHSAKTTAPPTARVGALMAHHPVCMSHHPSTLGPLQREAVGGSSTAQRVPITTWTLNMVAEQHDHGTTTASLTHRCAKRDSGRGTQELAGDDARTSRPGSSPTRTVWTTLMVCTSARMTSTSTQLTR